MVNPSNPFQWTSFGLELLKTYDVIVEPKAGHYQIEAESIDRSGYAIGTLHINLS